MKKKVLFLITKSNLGGAQRYVYDLATSLDTELYDIAVAHGGNGELVRELQSAHVRTIPIPSLVRDISLRREAASFWDIHTILKRERPDILHVNSSKAGGIGAFLGRLHRIRRVVYTAHGWAFNEDRSFPSRFIVGFFHWLTIMLADVTIAVSEETKRQMPWPWAQGKMSVIHNGRKPILYKEKRAAREDLINRFPRLGLARNDLWSVTVAELHPVKRHDVAIRAMHELVSSGTNLRHVIIGEGEERTHLLALIRELELEEHVFLTGHIENAARLLKAFDIFILPSRSEALSYALIEAAQAGLPIIATKTGGIPEIITHQKDGLLVAREDKGELARALRMLVENSELRQTYAHNIVETSARFSLSRMLRETEAVYNS